MKRRVYIETSVISYLTARPSNDSIKSACQHITRLWWDMGRTSVLAFISPYVVEEASAGDPLAALERIEVLRAVPVLPIAPEILDLAEFLLLGGGLPPKARLDALHIACAAYHEIDVLLTWNCTHIANPTKLPVMRGLCAAKGYKLPELVTPFELMEVPQ
jgi:predicted nucleic acid-binding protein